MNKRFLLSTLGYAVATFALAAPWHFILFKDFYFSSGAYNREHPLFAFGIASMLMQGAILAWLFPAFRRGGSSYKEGLQFAWAMGLFTYSLTAVAFVAKTQVASLTGWLGIQAIFHWIQFTLAGLVLGFVHRQPSAGRPA